MRLEFPKTEIQVYGNTVLVYTTYVYEIEMNGKRNTSSGRATEMFVRRGDDLVNVGWHMDSGSSHKEAQKAHSKRNATNGSTLVARRAGM